MLQNLTTKQLIRLYKMRLYRSYYLENSLDHWYRKGTKLYIQTENSYWIVRNQAARIYKELAKRRDIS